MMIGKGQYSDYYFNNLSMIVLRLKMLALTKEVILKLEKMTRHFF
jgi:hypothetical protein